MRSTAPQTALSSTAPLRVMYVLDTLRRGGKERQAIELAKGLRRDGRGVPFVVSMGANEFERETESLSIPVCFLRRFTRWDPLIFARFYRIVRSFKPDLVHTFCDMTAFYSLPVCRMLGIPVVNGSIRDAFPQHGFRSRFAKMLLNASDAVIANSAAGLASKGLEADGSKYFIVRNGFDFGRLQSRPLAAFSKDNKQIVGMVASFSKNKDYTSFFRAAEHILRKRDDILFWAIGDGEFLESYRKSFESESIVFWGKTNNVEDLVRAVNIGVLCTYTEGISNAVMEYMACGKPVVVTKGGGSAELVLDGETGFLVPPSDPMILAQRIESLIDNLALAQQMGQAGNQRLRQHFSVDALVDRTLAVYETALHR
jgi:glycosyltransferase involved in cell wall biosynthesis